MELLAPAGSREALERAQAAGADAVYLGYAAFSARAGAGNFDEAALREAVSFAHLHRMRVYVTVNTLVREEELPEAVSLLRLLAELRVDGVLVQDLGILRRMRTEFPGMRVHASTQMAIHNETGVRWCGKMGMRRVVLARECSREEIARCARTGMEIEVFGHGAQCVAVSGECLFSSMVGERSGNRGRCAQPCRKKYRFDGKEGAWLSPRDLCLRDQLPEIADTGADSLKIEGRLKRPEYVYTVTESYRRGLDGLERGVFHPADPEEMDGLKQIFQRGGFMTGYAFGTEDAGVIAPETVNHQGLRLGKIIGIRGNLARLRLERELHDGDGLRLRRGRTEAEFTYAGKDLPAGEIAMIRLREGLKAGEGDEVWRLTDAAQLAEAMAAPLRRIPVDVELRANPGEKLQLRLSDGASEVHVSGETVSAARNRITTAEEMEKQLRKTGGTDWEVRGAKVDTGEAFVPVSALNALRREGLACLAAERIRRFEARTGLAPEGEDAAAERRDHPDLRREQAQREGHRAQIQKDRGSESQEGEPELWVTVRTPEQAEACRGEGIRLIWYPEDFRREQRKEWASWLRAGDWLRLPETCEENTLQELYDYVCGQREILGGVVLGSVGQLGRDWPLPVAAGPGVPVMNREAARLLKEAGCEYAFASPELTGEETNRLMEPAEDLPRMIAGVYGRTQLMLLHHCPARTALGWRQGHGSCALCDRADPRALRGKMLEEERGYRFPLLRLRLPEGCLVRLMNTLPTDVADKPVRGIRGLEMTTETAQEALSVLRSVESHRKSPGESTRGHWNRPVL